MSGLVKYLKVWLSVETKTISKMLTIAKRKKSCLGFGFMNVVVREKILSSTIASAHISVI
jgi:hypothetical protein